MVANNVAFWPSDDPHMLQLWRGEVGCLAVTTRVAGRPTNRFEHLAPLIAA